MGLFAAVLLVVGIGVGVAPAEPQATVHSAAEQAQLDAEGRYRALAADARAASTADPALAGVLTALADDLAAQADAVALPRSPGAPGSPASPGPSQAPSTGTADPSPPPAPADAARVLRVLRDSALRSLQDAVDAAPGPGRVLAAAGANQWRHAVLLGAALGADAGLPSADALPADDLAAGTGLFAEAVPAPTESAPAGPGAAAGAAPSADASAARDASPAADPGAAASTREASPVTLPSATPASVTGPGTAPGADRGATPDCAGTPLGPEADRQALLSARTAEEQARFGYEVAAALLPDTAARLARSAVHGDAADAAARRLVDLCVEVAPSPAGFTIGQRFRSDPAAALRELEEDHAALYAGLVATVGPDTRAWAVVSYNAAVQRSLDAGTPLRTFPGLADAAVPGPGTAPAGTPAPGAPAPAEPEEPEEPADG